jgi:hypothetical protein
MQLRGRTRSIRPQRWLFTTSGAWAVKPVRLAVPHVPVDQPLRGQPLGQPFGGGAGTGLFIDRADAGFNQLVLLDINEHCLARVGRRLARFRPTIRQANLLAQIEPGLGRFDSVGLTYVLHCLPGSMGEKVVAVDHLKPLMAEGGVLFGTTILGRGVAANRPARALLDLYNAKGVFNNRADDFEALTEGLRKRFPRVEIERQGCVALFRAR